MSKNLIVKHIFSVILGAFFVNVGIAHFTDTKWFEPIVPSVLGNPTFLGSANWYNGSITWPRIDFTSDSALCRITDVWLFGCNIFG